MATSVEEHGHSKILHGMGLKGKMTKEDVLGEYSEGDVVLDRYRALRHTAPRTVIHQVASAPMPSDSDFSFFDPGDPQCREVLFDPHTTVPELFAVLRQWVPQVQKNIGLIGNEILKRGCGVNDRDGLTDMSLLHYCCKAGAPGIGDAAEAASFARKLLALGAEPSLRSRWTNMSALHYAAYFDVPPLIRVVLQAAPPGEVDATCSDFDFGTALHIAAANLCTAAVRCLLELGANPAFRDDKGQCPADVVPEPLDMPLELADAAAQAKELRALLQEALPCPIAPLPLLPGRVLNVLSDKACAQLSRMGLRIGDKVVIAGQKVGTLRFCGSTEFAGGLWAGVELQHAEGKNDGSVAGVQYFSCPMKHGIFAPLSKISKLSERWRPSPRQCAAPVRPPRHIDLARVRSRIYTAAIKAKSFPVPEAGMDELSDIKTGPLSRSCSTSSSSSLDSRQAPARYPPLPTPRQRRPLRPRQDLALPTARSTFLPPPPRPRSLGSTPLSGVARSRTPSAGSSVSELPEVHLGERVLVVGQRTGVVRFYGKTSFAPGFWLGIELDKPSGKNDGSVGGVKYFSCPPKHGVFAPPSRVQRIHGSVDCLSVLSSSRHNRTFSGIRRSFSTSSAIVAQREPNQNNSANRSYSSSVRHRWSTPGAARTALRLSAALLRRPGSSAAPGSSTSSESAVKLHLGMQVLLSGANEMGTIRYLGMADFAPGLWLGLELRSAKGRNDGSVGCRRYFSCRPSHGVLVRPSRVTYRGINGAKLVDESS
ncbi:CAP-Gly domain-containing linker protein 4 isoform X3 [Electrophorus electricus]|uniref:CAP-Gly domain-containing linker protein 4 isoform X3 n=1 Tax=Electrophorus electricus TaxID=8005 RepID=UPI0015D07FAE|nr:CAP-Gly domain-containing linker protein 4 isoform X3 [Electrophorus electricus]